MKVMFVEAKYNKEVVLPDKLIKGLPKHIALFTTIQFYKSIEDMKTQLESKGIKVELLEARHTCKPGQILGCSVERWNTEAEAFLYVGDGRFHPLALSYNNKKRVYTYNPLTKKTGELSVNEVRRFEKKRKAAMSAFLIARKVGVVVTTKYGQQRLNLALEMEKKHPDKEFFILVANNINPQSLENFPFIECFVNTACPRMIDEYDKFPKPVVNIEELGFKW